MQAVNLSLLLVSQHLYVGHFFKYKVFTQPVVRSAGLQLVPRQVDLGNDANMLLAEQGLFRIGDQQYE